MRRVGTGEGFTSVQCGETREAERQRERERRVGGRKQEGHYYNTVLASYETKVVKVTDMMVYSFIQDTKGESCFVPSPPLSGSHRCKWLL